MKKVRARVIVDGLVQGVFFRAHTKDEAVRRGVGGWVRNNHNGTVEAVFEGEGEAVKKMVEWCRHGPPGARVQDVDVLWGDFQNEFNNFTIRYRD